MDDIDRTLIGLLQEDASRTYADLAAAVTLSTGAVHERVRKLRQRGIILRTTVDLDAKVLGRPVVAFVLMETEGWITKAIRQATIEDPRVEDLHTVAGEANFVLKVRVGDPAELQRFLRSLYDVAGVRRTRTLMVLDTYVDRRPGVAPVNEELSPPD
ncbi:Lrp/AsnC family transcriptional regulator [Streptomyces sp. NPDC059224]|uniref:Lrp/AsnC family transcriptional regulator n=1 Tax=Streptomyces sp. NPDC059224 TaxID=3346775 RepID=UPI0036C6EE67